MSYNNVPSDQRVDRLVIDFNATESEQVIRWRMTRRLRNANISLRLSIIVLLNANISRYWRDGSTSRTQPPLKKESSGCL